MAPVATYHAVATHEKDNTFARLICMAIVVKMSNLQNKSAISQDAAMLLHDKSLYPSVAHCSYYSCYQLLKHIWIYTIEKTQQELDAKCSTAKTGSHELLINEVGRFIKHSGKKDCLKHFREFNSGILQLKRLRVDADYSDSLFDSSKSKRSLDLAALILPILKKY
ncbi:hypothetical protein Barb6_00329 [Bacteroidales bacterium Barb6]|nr:hypothetical protein Barb6_00329 [Bacteroidales bacterium Barb6]